jgi:cysteine synthase A
MRLDTILDAIGNTPHVRLNRLFRDVAAERGHEVWMKLERQNPGYSIKDRIARAMVEDAERAGHIAPGRTLLVEPTSGNTGIGLAMVAAVKGYELVICMPESFSVERRRVMQAFGARLELTPREGGMKAAIARAEALVAERVAAAGPDGPAGAWMPMQFENASNLDVHRRTTAEEVLRDFPEGLDVTITGVGTGGHITALGEVLKQRWPDHKAYAVEPTKSPVISGGTHTPHRLQGIGAGFIPGNLHREVLDGVVQVDEEAAFEMARRCAREEGIFVGPSSGASLAAVAQMLPQLPPGSRVLTFCYDTGDRYLSVEGLFAAGA